MLTFSEEIRSPIRPSAVEIRGPEGAVRPGILIEARGRLILLHPSLPCSADLQDGSFPAGSLLRLRLSGVPRLQAIAGESGAFLHGDLDLSFRTLAAAEPSALSGIPALGEVVRVEGFGEAGLIRLGSARAGNAELRFNRALDPRTLLQPARLEMEPSDGKVREVRGSLRENRLEQAILHLDLGEWTGRGVLTLPESWEGLGGVPIAEVARRLRVVRGP